MLELEDKDILAFLDGNASGKGKKAVKEWAYESLDNANQLAQLKKVHAAANELGEYNPVDVDGAWDDFKKLVANSTTATVVDAVSTESLSDIEMLQLLDGELPTAQRITLENRLASDRKANAEYTAMSSILAEAKNTPSYIDHDVDAEWALMKTKISAADEAKVVTMPTVAQSTTAVHTTINENFEAEQKTFTLPKTETSASTGAYTTTQQETVERSIVPGWMKFAAAAAVLLLGGVFFWNNYNKADEIATYATTDEPMEIQLGDGSIVYLGPHSTLEGPKTFRKLSERKYVLHGEAEFDVAEDKTKPFIVEVDDQLGIEVLGTRFKIVPHPDYVKVTENIEGKVRFYKLKEKDLNNVVLEKGDVYGYDGTAFVDMNLPIIDNSQEYNILYVLDYLMANNSWKVISSPDMPFDEKGMVKVDLELPLDELLESLKERSDFDYVKLSCDNCYRVTRFKE